MKGLIIALNTNYTTETDVLFYGRSNGAYRIATLLRDRGHRVEVLDFFNFWTDEQLLKYINIFQKVEGIIDYVGIGYTFSSIDITKLNRIMAIIKKNNPNCRFFAGGYGVFAGTSTFHQNDHSDLVTLYLRGFADGAIEDLEKWIETGRWNLLTKNSLPNNSGAIKTTVDCNQHYKHFDLSRLRNVYVPSDCIGPNEPLILETCRGCIFKCKFCSFELIGKKKSDNYIRLKDDIKAEIVDNYQKWGTYKYIIADDTFNDNPIKIDMMYEISQEIDFKLEFWAFLRADLIHSRPGELEKMISFGLKSVILGIETLNPPTGMAIGKGFSGDRLKKLLLSVRQRFPDLKITGTFIIGLPYESIETFTENIEWAFNSGVFDNININQLTIPLRVSANNHPFSEFTDRWSEYGYRPMSADSIEYWQNKMSLNDMLNHRFNWKLDSHQYLLWENDQMNMFQAVESLDKILSKLYNLNKCDSTLTCFSNSFDGPTVYDKYAHKNKLPALRKLIDKYIATKFCQESSAAPGIRMNNFYEYIDFPKVPRELLEAPEVIFKKPPLTFKNQLDSPNDPAKRTHWPVAVSDKLLVWLKDNIARKCYVWYLISTTTLPDHRDHRQYCYNYIIETGGDDVLIYGKIDKNNTEWVQFEPNRWIKLNTHLTHGTVGKFENGPRILLQITPIESYPAGFQKSIGY